GGAAGSGEEEGWHLGLPEELLNQTGLANPPPPAYQNALPRLRRARSRTDLLQRLLKNPQLPVPPDEPTHRQHPNRQIMLSREIVSGRRVPHTLVTCVGETVSGARGAEQRTTSPGSAADTLRRILDLREHLARTGRTERLPDATQRVTPL